MEEDNKVAGDLYVNVGAKNVSKLWSSPRVPEVQLCVWYKGLVAKISR